MLSSMAVRCSSKSSPAGTIFAVRILIMSFPLSSTSIDALRGSMRASSNRLWACAAPSKTNATSLRKLCLMVRSGRPGIGGTLKIAVCVFGPPDDSLNLKLYTILSANSL